jgi:ketosteroid isomerase-like protein
MAAEVQEQTRAVTFKGGTEADQQQLLAIHETFVAANDALDADRLRSIWSVDPDFVFFNANGFNYYGLEDWLKVWDYYRSRLLVLKPSSTGHIRITVGGEMALITDDWIARYRTWKGHEHEPNFNSTPYFRSTQVCTRETGEWKVMHAHFSSGHTGLRPDQEEPES